MAFGLKGNGDFIPHVRYDARAGKMFTVDDKTPHEVPIGTVFEADFGTFEVGYVYFGAQGPERVMTPWPSDTVPEQPSPKDEKGKPIFKSGFRLLIANKQFGIREWMSSAACVVSAIEELYNEYAEKAEPGLIPLVKITKTLPVVTGQGLQKSTNYKPVFQITGWVQRASYFGYPTVGAFLENFQEIYAAAGALDPDDEIPFSA